jgi:DNA-binding transcriptional regulator YiaG
MPSNLSTNATCHDTAVVQGVEELLPLRERMDRAISLVLAATRRELRMSQPDLAVELGWTRNEIANVERRRTRSPRRKS